METWAKNFKKVLWAAAALALISPQPTQAMLLSGHLEERKEGQDSQPSTQPSSQQPGQQQAAQPAPLQSQTPQLSPLPSASLALPANQARGASRPGQPATANSFPLTYQGAWYCETTVIDSTLPAVAQGQVIGSEVVFYPAKDGTIHARWNQPGWVETQSQAVTFNGSEAKADRTTYYFGDNMQGSWAARARDQFAQTSADAITAKSYVDQYMDGQYLGRYRTVSVLKRNADSQNMANGMN